MGLTISTAMVISPSVCTGIALFAGGHSGDLRSVAPLRWFEEDLTISTAMVISTSVCTWLRFPGEPGGDLRFDVFFFRWYTVFPSLSAGLPAGTLVLSSGGGLCLQLVFWVDTFIRTWYGPLYLAAACSVLICLRSACVDSSGRRLPNLFLYSALVGSTVDTCSRQFTEASWFSRIFCVKVDLGSLSGGRFRPGWFCFSCCVSFDCAECVPLHGGRPMLCGIVVGMDQNDSFYVHKPVVIPQVQFLDRLLRLFDEARGDSTGAVLGQGDVPMVERQV